MKQQIEDAKERRKKAYGIEEDDVQKENEAVTWNRNAPIEEESKGEQKAVGNS